MIRRTARALALGALVLTPVVATSSAAQARPVLRLSAHLTVKTPAKAAGSPVTLGLHLSLPAGRHLRRYTLLFGDGTSQHGTKLPLSVKHTYVLAGSGAVTEFFPATLSAVDSSGRTAKATVRVVVAQTMTLSQAQALTSQWWARYGPSALADLQNGQCTDYASRQRPDIIATVEQHAYLQSLMAGVGIDVSWVAAGWARNASAAGMRTGNTPAAGAIAVFQSGKDGAGSSGHVGYVEAVNDDGSYLLREENLDGLYRMSSRTLPGGTHAGVSFIY